MTTRSFDFWWISASAGDVARTAAVTTRPSASVDLMVLFMVLLLFKFSVDPQKPSCPSSKSDAV